VLVCFIGWKGSSEVVGSDTLGSRSQKRIKESCTTVDVPHIRKEGDNTMIQAIRKFIRDEEGQDLVEYALLLVFIALAAIAVLPTLGSAVNNVFSQSASTLGGS
jgi:Flp pilus assembly pilin Flp